MSSGDSYMPRGSGSKDVSGLASSFLQSMGQELIHAQEGGYKREEHEADVAQPYPPHDDYQRHRDRLRDDERARSRESRERRSRRGERSKERTRSRDEKPSHRDRDHGHHHHRSSGGRSERDYHRRSSRRSVSPAARRSSRESRHRREEDVVPLHKRPRRLNNWDVAPPGMEGMTATQVKQTGLFALPGQVLGTKTPQSFAPPSEHANYAMDQHHHHPHRTFNNNYQQGDFNAQTASNATPISSAARQARRLYVGQIPYAIDEHSTSEFFNDAMRQLKGTNESFVSSVQINRDKNYAFVEFKTPEQATAAMAFDGIQFQGQILKIRRPKDYQPPNDGSGDAAGPTYLQQHGLTSVPDSPDKIFIGGLPTYLTDDQVVELLKSFGELKAFNLVKDTNGQSKGYAFCEYADVSVTDLACQGLNNMELGEKRLIVQRASVGAKNAASMGAGATGSNSVALEGRSMMTDIPFTGANDEDATRVLQLLNMVVPEELEDDEEYQDIWQDIAEECSKFGAIVDMKIPRPAKDQEVPGCGSIFVRFETKEQAVSALQSLAGRKFADRTVVASYIDEDKYLTDFV